MLNKLSLNTIGLNRIGLNRIGKPSRGSSGRPYIDPEVLASLKAVCICYGKSNDDPDRAIVKNLVDPDNPFIISNAAYKLNSGFGKYDIDFTIFTNKFNVDSLDAFKVILDGGGSLFRPYSTLTENYPSWKGKVTFNNSNFTGTLTYDYRDNSGKEQKLTITQDGIYQFPICYNTETGDGTFTGLFNRTNSAVTIEQIPSYQGAFVTDGVNDLITSTKTIGQMVGENGDYTIISMIHQISYTHETEGDYDFALTNYIRSGDGYTRSRVTNIGKTAIYGYYANPKNSDAPTYNNILGDKADLFSETNAMPTIYNDKISIQGYVRSDGLMGEFSELAWYWTIFAKGQLTTDQINQVIAYYNLDRCVEPTVWYDVQKQGLTNDTPDSDWYLKDFSKNGFDMSLFNFAKDGDSGIGKYNYPNWKVTATVAKTYSTIVNYPTVNGTYSINVSGVSEMMQSIGMHLEVKYTTPTGTIYNDIKQDGVYSYILPDGATDLTLRFGGIPGIVNEPCNITITQIPSHAGALCFDGVNDYGQFVGDLGLKDYTVVVDRAYEEALATQVPIISSAKNESSVTPFLMEHLGADSILSPYSFGTYVKLSELNINRFLSYQSTYKYNGINITRGVVTNTGSGLTIGKFGTNNSQYAKLALWSLLLFPYSLSEFLIERQLKKHKLGTLYPDMVEWRPIYTSNVNDYTITKATYFGEAGQRDLNLGNHYPIGTRFRIYVKPSGAVDEVTSIKVNGVELTYDYIDSNYGYAFNGTLSSKSPQKIDITIYQPPQYLTMLSNSTLISNETLIKNE